MAEWLPYFFYLVVGSAIVFYCMTDGFDLGVGCLHLLAKGDQNRRIFLNSIGPVWDGNEVWLVIVMGGLFAGFPEAFATIFSAFYSLFTMLMAALIIRAVAIEMRSKRPSPIWRAIWDGLFFLGSVSIAFLLGVTLANLVQGLPLNRLHEYQGNFSDFFSAYTILVGLLAVSLFAMHGAIYLIMKTEGGLQQQLRSWVGPAVILFLALFVLTTGATLVFQPHMVDRFRELPWLFVVIALGMAAIANILLQVRKQREGWAFASSCAAIVFFISLFGIGTFPLLVRSTIDPTVNSLTITNACSGTLTLTVLSIIVAIGIPLVLGYMAWVYKTFAGKVRLDSSSY
jgi:cytochrome d ubiquinol oxidase subunit II